MPPKRVIGIGLVASVDDDQVLELLYGGGEDFLGGRERGNFEAHVVLLLRGDEGAEDFQDEEVVPYAGGFQSWFVGSQDRRAYWNTQTCEAAVLLRSISAGRLSAQ